MRCSFGFTGKLFEFHWLAPVAQPSCMARAKLVFRVLSEYDIRAAPKAEPDSITIWLKSPRTLFYGMMILSITPGDRYYLCLWLKGEVRSFLSLSSPHSLHSFYTIFTCVLHARLASSLLPRNRGSTELVSSGKYRGLPIIPTFCHRS